MKSRRDVVLDLVNHHFEVEPDLTKVYVFGGASAENEPVRLLELNEGTVETGGLEVFGFGPSVEFPYSLEIAEVTSAEFERLARAQAFPSGWDPALAIEISRPRAA